MSKSQGAFIVYAISPLDFFYDATVTVQEWVAYTEDPPSLGLTRQQRWADFLAAVVAVSQHEYWEWELRDEPRVAYDAISDRYYFIFKIDNNGTTFVVSHEPIVGLERKEP